MDKVKAFFNFLEVPLEWIAGIARKYLKGALIAWAISLAFGDSPHWISFILFAVSERMRSTMQRCRLRHQPVRLSRRRIQAMLRLLPIRSRSARLQ